MYLILIRETDCYGLPTSTCRPVYAMDLQTAFEECEGHTTAIYKLDSLQKLASIEVSYEEKFIEQENETPEPQATA